MDQPDAVGSATLLKGARIVDGTGRPSHHGDVLIRGGTIAEVGEVDGTGVREVVDLSDLVLAPGFIDSHTHYDAQMMWDPDLTPSSAYGITSVLFGNCGYSIAPARERDREMIILTLEAVEGMSREGLEAGIEWSFETFGEYLDAVRRTGTRLNVAAMVGHSTIRSYVMGPDSIDRSARAEEVVGMSEVLGRCLDEGAFGFSTSRSEVDNGAYGKPVGSRLADYSELLALAGVLRQRGTGLVQALPCSMRDGPETIAQVAADLVRASGRHVVFSSVLTGMFGPRGSAMAALDTFGGVEGSYAMVSCLPLVQQVTLRDPFILALYSTAFTEALERDPGDRASLYADAGWRSRAREGLTPLGRQLADVVVAETIVHPSLEGRTLGSLASERGTEPIDVMVELSLAEDLEIRFRVPLHNSDEEELRELLLDRRCLLGLSDAGAHQSQICDAVFSLHLLQHWVRELEALPLEFAIWRLTGHQAAALQLGDRGMVAPGMAADLVAFDPTTVGYGPLHRVRGLPAGADRLVATSRGVEHTWVNGQLVRRDQLDVPDARPGTILRQAPAA
ncbi:MAG TPA: amidohydrolase family protein [Acidimicrobiales bacterium]|nr:amidohydrolase family protein [Acidimicrobiales bacterium]